MELNYKEFGQGEPVLILHGLFGTLDNWQTMARQLAQDYTVYILDQRNHGRSPHADTHDYPEMAEDLRRFMEQHWMYSGACVIGHSMGGKTAMQLALKHPELVKKLVVVDIAPRAYPGNHHEIFDALQSLELDKIGSRAAADEALARNIQEEDVRLFLMKNLTRSKEGGYEFKMNLPVLQRNYDHILAAVEGEQPFEGPALFIRGGRSRHIVMADEDEILRLFPNAHIATIENAGHWVHADAPAELLALTRGFLK
jgi:pimeloyl-ACP methyl ester carboxylesterase